MVIDDCHFIKVQYNDIVTSRQKLCMKVCKQRLKIFEYSFAFI